MVRVAMYYPVKTLLGQWMNIYQIFRELGVDRKIVKKIKD